MPAISERRADGSDDLEQELGLLSISFPPLTHSSLIPYQLRNERIAPPLPCELQF